MDEDDDLVEAEKAELTNKIHILELNLFILGNVRMDVMDVLQLPPNLHTLQLDYYKCNRFPKWITSFNYLRELSIRKCRNCSSLPLLGILPMLEELSVYHMENLEWVGNEFLGIKENVDEPSSSKFPMLKKLCFDHCNKWEEWKDISEEVKNSFSVMPNLCRLQITNCGRLKSLPHRLLRLTSSLQTLYIEECQFLTLRYKKSWGPNDNHLISHIPDLSIVFESKYYGYYDYMYGYY
ncbi:UNVERIFIED_CONTAM: hypothetical protein Scaly_0150500 [Sesamum calycinum]|uniref:R13L1/DRL21-like LRR repeat region domain-containing protein n=1 Tax=Sesamum calycinum TaxID=2727403 RepID=A0AAW2SZP2_9LAMI